ncbi:MAG: EAL domain-containing protein [Bdellovibrionales bacterium]
MWGIPMMVVSASVMLLGGALLFESYRRHLSVHRVSRRVDQIKDTQDEVISDIAQMRKYVEVANAPSGQRAQVKVKNKVSTPSDSKDSPKPFKEVLNQTNRPVTKPLEEKVQYSDVVTEELIYSALDRASVDVFMQPIVTLPQRRAVMMEAFARLRAGNGQSLSAQQYMGIAKAKNLQVRLDNLLLRQGLDALRKDVARGFNRSYMLNIEANTLRDMPFMTDVLSFLRENVSLASKLVFEIRQSDLVDMNKESLSVLKALAKLGCGVSMDQVDDPHLDREFMREVGVRYIKVSGARLREFSATEAGVEIMRRIKASLAEDAVSIIADKIEDERTLCEVLDLEIDYGQGYLFGKPDRESVYERPSRKTA